MAIDRTQGSDAGERVSSRRLQRLEPLAELRSHSKDTSIFDIEKRRVLYLVWLGGYDIYSAPGLGCLLIRTNNTY